MKFKISLKSKVGAHELVTVGIIDADDGAHMERIVQQMTAEMPAKAKVSWEPVPEVTISEGAPKV